MTKFSENDLMEIGFSQNLAKVYLALIEAGKVRASALIARLNMHRNQVYQALDQLIERKLASKTMKRGVALFEAADPRNLLDEFEMQKQRVSRVVDVLAEQVKQSPLEVMVYEGLEGITRAVGRNLSAPAGSTVYIMGASNLMNQPELAKYWDEYHAARIQHHIQMKGLFDRETDSAILKQRNQMRLTEARYLPQTEKMPAWFNLCQDMLIIVVPGGEHPQAIAIRNQAAVDSLRSHFNYLWQQAGSLKHN